MQLRGILILSVCLPNVLPAGGCNKGEYWHKLLGKCEPCNWVCDPPSRGDCKKNCPEVAMSALCGNDQFWYKLLRTCMDCATICGEPVRRLCKDNCDGYLAKLTSVTPSQNPDSNPEPTTPPTIKRWIDDHVTEVAVLSGVGVVAVVAIVTLVCCFCPSTALRSGQCACFGPNYIKAPTAIQDNGSARLAFPLVERQSYP